MINYQFNIKWSRKLGQMGPVGSTRLIRGDIRKCTMLIGYCPKKAFSSIHYFLSANLYKRQERKVPVVMAHRNSRTQIHLYCLHSWSTTQTQHIFWHIYMRLRWTSQAKDVSALMDMVSCLIKSVDTVIKRQNDLQETLNDKKLNPQHSETFEKVISSYSLATHWVVATVNCHVRWLLTSAGCCHLQSAGCWHKKCDLCLPWKGSGQIFDKFKIMSLELYHDKKGWTHTNEIVTVMYPKIFCASLCLIL